AQRDPHQNVEKFAHDPLSRGLRRTGSASTAGFRASGVAVQPFAHFLAGFEKRHTLLIHRNVGACARIAAGTGRPVLYRESTKTAQLHPIAACQGSDDLVEDRVDDILDIPLVEVRVMLGDTLNEFGLDHRGLGPGKLWTRISVKMP